MKLVQKHPRELFKITVKAVTILPQEQNFSKHKKESARIQGKGYLIWSAIN